MDIEILDYEDKLEVDKTMTLAAAVVPSNATESIITYTSSNPAVATVNSSGEVKGIAKGEVIIYCSAGNVKKEAHINVFVATERLSINNDYLVMKPGSSFSLKATVTPAEASSELTYKSADDSVAFVSANGTVTAKKCGRNFFNYAGYAKILLSGQGAA